MLYIPIELLLIAWPLPAPSMRISNVSQWQHSFRAYPAELQVGTPPQRYVRQPEYYAVHYGQPEALPAADRAGAVMLLGQDAIAVFHQPAREPATSRLSPVYALQPSGTLAVPTGLVFIRFQDGVMLASQQAALQQAGYEIAQTLDYAPQAGWLRARSGNMADALSQLAQLQALPQVERVEPQLLMQRSSR